MLFLPQYMDDPSDKDALPAPEFIAHGGGLVLGIEKSNASEALENNFQSGFRFFEIDFNWTSDGDLVAIHDWDTTKQQLFGGDVKRMSLEEFKYSIPRLGLTPVTLDDIGCWIVNGHQDAYVVTDIKERNLEALKMISERHKSIRKNFIPQIYRFDQIGPVRGLGFDKVILTLYSSDYTDEGLVYFVNSQRPFAVTLPHTKANPMLIKKLRSCNVFVYTHGVNDAQEQQRLRAIGIQGFYVNSFPRIETR